MYAPLSSCYGGHQLPLRICGAEEIQSYYALHYVCLKAIIIQMLSLHANVIIMASACLYL